MNRGYFTHSPEMEALEDLKEKVVRLKAAHDGVGAELGGMLQDLDNLKRALSSEREGERKRLRSVAIAP